MKKELSRLQKLADLDIDYEKQKEQLQPFVELAKYITNSPVCEINIIDGHTQWTIARTEDSLKAIPREESVCHDTIQQDSTYEIPDLSSNNQYQDRFYVTGKPHFRYYCGVQLTTSDGFNLGSICVLDMKTKEISGQQKKQLEHLAQLVVNHIEREGKYFTLSEKLDELQNSLRNLNHDVRSPINGIVGIADLLIHDEKHPDLPKEDLTMIKESAQAIIDKIDGVLTTMDVSGSKESYLKATKLSSVHEKIIRLYGHLAKQKNQSLSLNNQINTDFEISYHLSVILTQIIGNLVGNAIKFTPEKGSINVVFSRKIIADKSLLNITVRDNGKGLTDEQVTSFNKGKDIARSKGSAGEQSFGIGLAHVQQLIGKQNGSISVKKNEKQGATFSLLLPFQITTS